MSVSSAPRAEPAEPPAETAEAPAQEVGTLLPIAMRVDPVAPDASLDHPALYFNRELSWLDFNWRVVFQAIDERVPLLERARFLAIAESNLNEFFAKRVGVLKSLLRAGVDQPAPDGRTPGRQMDLIREAVIAMRQRMALTWLEDVCPRIEQEAGVALVKWNDLSTSEQAELTEFFRSSVYPVLTPLAVDPGHPFPFISHLSLSLAISLEHPERGTEHFARVKLPLNRGRWVRIGQSNRYLPLETLIAQHVGELFRGMRVRSVHEFRVTRSAELEREGADTDDLLRAIEEELRERRFAPPVRLEVDQSMPQQVRDLLLSELELHPNDLYEVDGMLDLTSLSFFADLTFPHLRFEPWEPITPAALDRQADVFAVLRQQDVLVHHPYESFAASVERFIEDAARDPKVIAIKQTLYRISDDSRVARALILAAEEGKQVAVLVEVTASLDEERNIEWAQRMEKVGVHVTYGVVGLKTHTKITLVVRDDGDAIRTYCHIGTGNYHERTARLYTDLGLFTSSKEIGSDVVNLFHFLTGFAPEQEYENLLVAPRDLRRELTELIAGEIEHGTEGRIVLKLNGIDDVGMIKELYRASQAGVRIDLIVRGHTRLRPGVPGISDNIRLISILGRFLEHDRIFYFHNRGKPSVFIGSADWRRRNLVERVEAIVRIDNPALKERLYETLELALSDNRTAWDLRPDGRYLLRYPLENEPVVNFQETLMRRVREAGLMQRNRQRRAASKRR
jgi:polyphosphate kinase